MHWMRPLLYAHCSPLDTCLMDAIDAARAGCCAPARACWLRLALCMLCIRRAAGTLEPPLAPSSSPPAPIPWCAVAAAAI